MILPDIAISRDGQRAILVEEIDSVWYPVGNHHAYARHAEVRVAPRARLATLQLIASGEVPTHWNHPQQELRWKNVDFEKAFPELAMAAIGEYLDHEPVPSQSNENHHAAVVLVKSDIMQLFAREPETEDLPLLRYIAGKVFWGYRLGLDAVPLQRHDALRFGINQYDLRHVAKQSEGILWNVTGPGWYQALPRLLTDFRAGALPGLERPKIEQVLEIIDKSRYPAAAHHIGKAIAHLHGDNADPANAAKEAVSAVESVCKTLLNKPTATMGDCVTILRKANIVTREIARILESLYAYRNATPGVGHGGISVPSIPESEARLMIGLSAEAIAYLDSLWPGTTSYRQ